MYAMCKTLSVYAQSLLRKHFMKGLGLVQYYFPYGLQAQRYHNQVLAFTFGLRLAKLFMKTNTCNNCLHH